MYVSLRVVNSRIINKYILFYYEQKFLNLIVTLKNCRKKCRYNE